MITQHVKNENQQDLKFKVGKAQNDPKQIRENSQLRLQNSYTLTLPLNLRCIIIPKTKYSHIILLSGIMKTERLKIHPHPNSPNPDVC